MSKLSATPEQQAFAVFRDDNCDGNAALVILTASFDRGVSLEQQFKRTQDAEVSAACLLQRGVHNDYEIRWTNTQQEIQFCGHGALAAAAFLDGKGKFKNELGLQFSAGKYWLRKDKNCYWFSSKTATDISSMIYPHSQALLGRDFLESAACMGSEGYLIVRVDDDLDIREIEPNLSVLEATTNKALILTSRQTQDSGINYSLRYFAPQYGVPEDPATGSANEVAAQFWFSRINTQTLKCYQASASGGTIYAEKDENGHIWIGGKVVAL